MKTARIKIENKESGIITEKSFLNMNRKQVIEMLNSSYSNYKVISIEVRDLNDDFSN